MPEILEQRLRNQREEIEKGYAALREELKEPLERLQALRDQRTLYRTPPGETEEWLDLGDRVRRFERLIEDQKNEAGEVEPRLRREFENLKEKHTRIRNRRAARDEKFNQASGLVTACEDFLDEAFPDWREIDPFGGKA